ncbi:MAG: aminotransferase class V-fold PLP-dependent enzyme [Clostridia bacterium]|nr:aminotransferase class V-fold PLP-dependent enzyme [Clostridia bacterium]
MIYFDNAATSYPKSPAAVRAVAEAMRSCGNPGRGGHAPAMRAAKIMYECREKAARAFGTDPERVILAPSGTAALNMAVKGYIKSGKVLISNLEHNAVCRPLYAMRGAGRIELVSFDALAKDAAEDFAGKVKGASAAVFTHGSNVCGKLLPLGKLVKLAHENGALTVVDAAQTAGYREVSLERTGADIVCCAGHKGLGGPMGTGLLLINRVLDITPATILEGGTGVYSRDEDMPPFLPERLEAGTPAVALFAGLSAALDEFSLYSDFSAFDLLCDSLRDIKGVTVYCPDKGEERLPVLLFNIEGMDCDDVMNRLARKGICVRSGFHCAPLAHRALGTLNGGVRVSLGKQNTAEEVKIFCREIAAMAKTRL